MQQRNDGGDPSGLLGTLPVDLSVDAADWLSDFNNVSLSWVPIASPENDSQGALIDAGTLGDLFQSSFNMWNVVDNPSQILPNEDPST